MNQEESGLAAGKYQCVASNDFNILTEYLEGEIMFSGACCL